MNEQVTLLKINEKAIKLAQEIQVLIKRFYKNEDYKFEIAFGALGQNLFGIIGGVSDDIERNHVIDTVIRELELLKN